MVAATNRNLESMVSARTLREDLYYRLNAITLRMPPLRERRHDIAPLALHFLAESARELGRRYARITPEAMNLLKSYQCAASSRSTEGIARSPRSTSASRARPWPRRSAPGKKTVEGAQIFFRFDLSPVDLLTARTDRALAKSSSRSERSGRRVIRDLARVSQDDVRS